MKTFCGKFLILTICLVVLAFCSIQPCRAGEQSSGKAIDLVICLDSSNSMDALIGSAKQKLWDIVNEVAALKPTPVLRVALLSYGNDGYDPKTGWVRLETDLTRDLDLVNEKLFGLKTNGGTEYVGRVLSDSLKDIKWNKDKSTLRLIYVAGNEPADQDKQTSNSRVCTEAIQNDIAVNAIYCGAPESAEAGGWRDVARMGRGMFFSISQEKGMQVINTPFDNELARLSGELNKTYIAYGSKGQAAQMNQAAQDSNTGKMSSYAAANRAVAKSSEMYYNASWDLVDAKKEKGFTVSKIKSQDLPENMQKMSDKEKEAYISGMEAKRKDIQKQIQVVSKKRQDYIAKMKKGVKNQDTFDLAVRDSLRTLAAKKGFSVK